MEVIEIQHLPTKANHLDTFSARKEEDQSQEQRDGMKHATSALQEQDRRYLQGWHLQAVNLAVCMSLFLSDLELTIVSTSLVSITNAFAAFQKSSWVVTAYFLTFTGFIIIIAKLSDIYGRKLMLLLSIAVFTIFSVACGSAQTLLQLVIFRAFQGIGGGGMHALAWVILPDMVPREKYTFYATVVSSNFALSSLLGPILGGLINNHTTWRWIFFLNAPAGVFTIILVLMFLPSNFPHLDSELRPMRDVLSTGEIKRIDFFGAFMILSGSLLLVAALEEGGIEYSWHNAIPLSLLILSCLFWAGCLLWSKLGAQSTSVREPILPWRLVANRFSMGTLLNAFFVGSVFFTIVIDLPQKFQVVNGSSPFNAGYRLLALTLCVAAGAGISAQLIQTLRIAPFYVLLGGAGIQTLGLGLMVSLSVVQFNVPPVLYVYEVILGIGFGLSMGSVILMTTIVFDSRDIAVAMGSVAQFRVLGASILLSICTNLLNHRLTSMLRPVLLPTQLQDLLQSTQTIKELPPALQELVRRAYAEGFREQLIAMTVFSAAAIPATLMMTEKRPRTQYD